MAISSAISRAAQVAGLLYVWRNVVQVVASWPVGWLADRRLRSGRPLTPELAPLVNALVFGGQQVALEADRTDLAGIFIPDLIRVDLDLGGPGNFVRIDRGQLEQVLLNLAVNARDAMPNGGQLSISTHSTQPNNAKTAGSATGWIELRITDSGVGMSQEDRVHRVSSPG